MVAFLALGSLLTTASLLGTKVPAVELDHSFPPTKVNLAERVAGKKVGSVGLPGAFTPT
jgi:peroxiredoxin